ncbi:MAG: DNA repair protein RecN, partial [Chlorobi bacterium]|nr:DNA repair protein RecN [Chlorobiota bacterium]
MLRLLHVENFAVIEHVELRFGPAFNVITGETGAGKSLLVEALLSVLGERVSSDAIRSGARKAVIEAYFSIEGNRGITTLLDESGYPCIEENTLIVRREIAASGSRAFINDSPASLHLLKQLGELLVDFHGQHEHQSLLRTSLHRVLLDSVGGLDRLVSEFNAEYHRLVLLVEQYRQLLEREQQIRSQLGWYRHQLDELTAIAPQAGELQQLESELRRIEHSEQLYEGSSTAYSLLYGNDHSAHDVLVRARNIAEQLSCYDDYLRTVAAELRELVIRTDELAKDIQRYNAQLEFSPERSQYIRERLVQLGRLVKRYGSIERAIEEQQRIEREIALAENFDAEIEQLRVAIAAQRDLLGTIGERLSAKRQQVARRAERSIGEILRRLGMSDAEFSVVIEKALVPSPEQTELVAHVGDEFIAAYEHGLDQVSFHIRTNAGQPLAPLQRIISGGEASRVMLALKTILAKSDRLPILIFDEIDTGVSGRIAHRVGLALEELGAYHQVIAITHNPQIAARAQVHIVVEKHTS